MDKEVVISDWNIEHICNGYLVSVWPEDAKREQFFFDTNEEVLAFLETNLD